MQENHQQPIITFLLEVDKKKMECICPFVHKLLLQKFGVQVPLGFFRDMSGFVGVCWMCLVRVDSFELLSKLIQ